MQNLIDNIKKHVYVTYSLAKLQNFWGNNEYECDAEATFCNLDYVVDHMIYIKTNEIKHGDGYFHQLKQCVSFIKSTQHHHNLELFIDFDHLKELFNSFVTDVSSNDEERFIILDLLASYAVIGKDESFVFYFVCLEPLILEYKRNNNYSMLSKIYFVFKQYYRCYKFCSESSIQFLQLDHIKLVKCIVDELCSTENKIKYEHLIATIRDMIRLEKSQRIPLLDSNYKLQHETKIALKDMFGTFATNIDGTMSSDDFKRYAFVCGAGKGFVTTQWVNTLFELHGGEKTFSFYSFCRFYRAASLDRLNAVWNDFHIFQYDNHLGKNSDCGDRTLHNLLKYDVNYDLVLNKYIEIVFWEGRIVYNDDELWNALQDLPYPQVMKTRMQNVELMRNTFQQNESKNLHLLCYKLLIFDSNCGDDNNNCNNWRRQFIEKKGMDCLIKLFLQYHYRNNINPDWFNCCQVHFLGLAKLIKIMHHICSLVLESNVTLNVFMHHAFNTLKYLETKYIKQILDINQNYLIHLIILDAKSIDHNVDLLNVMPHEITNVFSGPLISGYIRDCNLSLNIPQDIIKIISFLF